MEQTRKQFTFYESFAVALRRIRRRDTRCIAYDAIIDYALYNLEPNLEDFPQSAAIAFDLIRPLLDSARKKAAAGHRGGMRSPNASSEEANDKQTASKKETEIEIEIENENKNNIYLENKLKGEGENEGENENEAEARLAALLRINRRIREEQSRRLRRQSEPPSF